MSRKRLIVKNRKRKKAYLVSFIALFLLFGLGYATMTSDMSISGSLGVTRYDRSLYTAFQKEVSKGYAVEYTGAHQDSFDGSLSTEKIYHWYATNDDQAIEILNRNNVIFANQCWQMIRTTDTGGVKLLYNGEVDGGKCLDSRDNHVGYTASTSMNLASNYYYGTGYSYDKLSNTFILTGTKMQGVWSDSNYNDFLGKYTCMSSLEDDVCSTLYLVESYSSNVNANVIPMNNSSSYSQYGTLQLNRDVNSLAFSGYMYNSVYPSQTGFGKVENVLYSAPIQTDYWYYSASYPSYELNPDTGNNEWVFDSSFQISDSSEYGSIVGKYTFQSTDPNYNAPTVQYIISVSGDTYYYINLVEGNGKDRYYFGDSYVDNGDGTYRIVSAISLDASNWDSNYGRLKNKYVCKNSSYCADVMFVTDANETQFSYADIMNSFQYASGFTWDGSSYTLSGDVVSFWNIADSENKALINTHHYTCWNAEGTCSTISYIHYIDDAVPYFISLTNGKSVEDAISEMLSAEDVNYTSSTMKNGLDAWYREFLSSYSDSIEDTIYCNNRSILNLNGWNPSGGDVTLPIQFKDSTISNDLSCSNVKDQFSVSNNSAKLTYKVGLMTTSEVNLLNNPYIRRNAQFYWLMTPNSFGVSMNSYRVDYDGLMVTANPSSYSGVRPVISLIPGIQYVSGNGTREKPYLIG